MPRTAAKTPAPELSPLDALGSPIRRDILRLLAARSLPVGALAAQLPVSRPAISKHLRVLKRAHLVTSEPSGAQNLYRLDTRGFVAARDWLESFWDDALVRLKLAAENMAPRGAAGGNGATPNTPQVHPGPGDANAGKPGRVRQSSPSRHATEARKRRGKRG